MIPGLNGMLLAGGLSAVIAGGLGMKAGALLEQAHSTRELERHDKAAAKLIEKKDGEIGTLGTEKSQCAAEVAKYNAASAEQVEKNRLVDEADRAARQAASQRMERLIIQASKDARDAAERSDRAREVILNVSDQCARAGVPADVLSVLNDILDPPKAGVRDGAMPSRPAPDRP